MARLPREHRLETRQARLKLQVRGEPYWRQVVPGTFIGYRKGKRASAWIVRQRVGGAYAEQRIGTPDDAGEPDGDVVLTYAQAVARAQAVQVEERKPQPRHYGDGDTLNMLVEKYLEERQVTPGGRHNRVMAASTAKVSGQAWNAHGADSIGTKLVTALTAKDLRKWHASLAAKPATVRGKPQPFDPSDPEQVRARRSSANRVLTIPVAALNWARMHERLPNDMPDWWAHVAPFSLGDDPIPRMLDTDEITRLLNAAAPDLRLLLQGALMTGARLGDLRALRVRDYDPESETVRVAASKTYKTTWQPLTAEGVALFDRLTAGRSPGDYMFTREDGSPWSNSDVTRPMREARKASGLHDATFKVTRATYGKLLLLATKDLELVAKALGHSDSRITRKHYAALLPSEVKAGIARLPSLGFDTDDKVSRIGKKRRAAARSA